MCVDPKTQRKYYYSRSLSKSTWTCPPHLVGVLGAASDANNNGELNGTNTVINKYNLNICCIGGASSRAGSATSKTRGTVAWRGRDNSRERDGNSRGRDRERDSSPAGSISGGGSRHTVRSASPAGSTSSSTRGGGGSAIWKSAKDPKSGRTYWFNRCVLCAKKCFNCCMTLASTQLTLSRTVRMT